ncbi:hypothetical protein [Mesobacillus maritimus]|uniref:Uncharacterized protein n=1 Tax=Mesobacillus maritimus TaxID=1643336 RepID=A0ABS7K8T8_9BACI|nr:hypothetical protein [Mesobacillus maritimus]MBY0098676.1 hypothetical protein [Mesobacillus maritimus]
MMAALFDVMPQLLNAHDLEVHAERGRQWERREREEFAERKLHAERLLRNDEPNNIFAISQVCKLSVMTVRELEAKYRMERGLK